jgi:hypothetical protein
MRLKPFETRHRGDTLVAIAMVADRSLQEKSQL